MRQQVVAIACSDIHLSLTPPVARSGEPDWLAAQARPLKEIWELSEKLQVPILCAGDVFDRWNSPVALTNWALRNVPPMVAIPGQHDLPNHQVEAMERSAYWNLCQHSRFEDLSAFGSLWANERIVVGGFPWGTDISPCQRVDDYRLHIALIHQYIWKDGCGYPGALEEAKLGKGLARKAAGWDVVVFGDNHKGFCVNKPSLSVFNCGGLMRRKSDEIDYRPQVGLIHQDGEVVPHFLDCSQDVIKATVQSKKEDDLELESFLEELTGLGRSELDFTEAVKQALAGRSPAVTQLVMEALQG